MTAKEPVIRFSPFEALFIGEKNRILKRQPMKNTIYVTRLNRSSKAINLKDLFGPEKREKSTQTKYNDVIFKVPQRVCDFLRHRRLHNTTRKSIKNEESEILCYEFEGRKMITTNNKMLLRKTKNIKPVKVRLKRKFKCKDSIHGKVVKKFASGHESRYKVLSSRCKNKNKTSKKNRHLLRGKDGKFIRKSEYEKLKCKEISPKQKYLANYLHQLYLKKNKQIFNKAQSNENENSPELERPYSVEAVVGLPTSKFDITASETMLNEISVKYYENNCLEDFHFPNFPKLLEPLEYENDPRLIDLIYENFPKLIKFQSQSQESDFSQALLDCDILKPVRNLKIYKKKKNGFVKDEEIREILGRRFPLIKLKRVNDIMPDYLNDTNMCSSKIDEPYTKKSHLITGKSFGSFFFRSAEGKDIFIGNLMKPFLQNSWFGSLPES